MVNQYLLDNTANMACLSINASNRKFKYTYEFHIENELEYCLFEPQARNVLKLDDSCSVDDLEKILQQLDSNEWIPILQQYAQDLHALFMTMPVLDKPMTVFRGESSWKDNPFYLQEDIVSRTIKSFTLDPCILFFFA